MKYGVYVLLLLGVVLTFIPFNIPFPKVYLKVLGVCLCMFSLYMVSSKLSSRERPEDKNLKF